MNQNNYQDESDNDLNEFVNFERNEEEVVGKLNLKSPNQIEDHELKALERHVNNQASRFWHKKETIENSVRYFLAPYISDAAYKAYAAKSKRDKALDQRRVHLLNFLPGKLGLEPGEQIMIENAIDNFLAPPSAGEDWDGSDKLEDMHFDWVCRELGLVPGDSFVLTAESGAGKTYLASHLALCVMSGKPVFGKYTIQRQGKVAHLNWDSNSALTKMGYKRLANGVDFIWKKGDLHYEQPNWKLNQDNAYENLKTICKGRTLCIIDSLRASYDGEENGSESSSVIALTNRVSEETNCAILFIAHAGKGGVGSKGIDALRGSSALVGACGAMWTLEREEGTSELKLCCPKGRLAQFAPIHYKYEETGEFLENINKTSKVEISLLECESVKTTIRDQILAALLAAKVMNKTDLKSKVIGRDMSISNEIKMMIDEEFIKEEVNPTNKREKNISLTERGALAAM